MELQDDVLLVKWLSNPDVLRYYEGRDNPFNIQKVREEFFQENDYVKRCIIEYENTSIGYIQYYEVEEEYREKYGYEHGDTIYGMDQFIGEPMFWNKGIGTLLVKSMVQYIMDELKADSVIMDPQTWNKRAIRCYEKSGFQKIKLLPQHEYHEGAYRDCWLIEYR